jgi:hypothetical protein
VLLLQRDEQYIGDSSSPMVKIAIAAVLSLEVGGGDAG